MKDGIYDVIGKGTKQPRQAEVKDNEIRLIPYNVWVPFSMFKEAWAIEEQA